MKCCWQRSTSESCNVSNQQKARACLSNSFWITHKPLPSVRQPIKRRRRKKSLECPCRQNCRSSQVTHNWLGISLWTTWSTSVTFLSKLYLPLCDEQLHTSKCTFLTVLSPMLHSKIIPFWDASTLISRRFLSHYRVLARQNSRVIQGNRSFCSLKI